MAPPLGRALLLLLLLCGLIPRVSAHRLKEVLQGALIRIEPDRIHLELDLTPAVATVHRLERDLNPNRDDLISDPEAAAFSRTVARQLRLRVDGRSIALRRVREAVPALDALRDGDGVVHLVFEAPLPRLEPGEHRLEWRNGYRPGPSVYLTHAVMPESPEVRIRHQERSRDQRRHRIRFSVSEATTDPRPGTPSSR